MLDELALSNFKIFDETGVDLRFGKVTVLIGSNGSGKSSILQALMLVKQSRRQQEFKLDGPELNLGTFRNIVHQQDTARRVRMRLVTGYQDFQPPRPMTPDLPTTGIFTYRAEMGEKGHLELNEGAVGDDHQHVRASWSPTGQSVDPQEVRFEDGKTSVRFTASAFIAEPLRFSGGSTTREPSRLNDISQAFRQLFETVHDLFGRTYLIPAIRGFSDASYEVLPQIDSADLTAAGGPYEQARLTANLLAAEPQLADEVSARLREVLPGRDLRLRVRLVPGGRIAIEIAVDRQSVNVTSEAFGLNQLVTPFLWLALAPPGSVVAIEEPEIHLHPRAQVALSKVLTSVAIRERKQLVMATHSEHILMGLLGAVAHGELAPADLAVYEFRREGASARAERLNVNERGQIAGGLSGFLEVELDEIGDLVSAHFPSTAR